VGGGLLKSSKKGVGMGISRKSPSKEVELLFTTKGAEKKNRGDERTRARKRRGTVVTEWRIVERKRKF